MTLMSLLEIIFITLLFYATTLSFNSVSYLFQKSSYAVSIGKAIRLDLSDWVIFV